MFKFKISTLKRQRQKSQVYVIKEAIYLELSMLEGHQQQNVTYFIPMSFINLPTAYKCMRIIFCLPQDSHWSTSTTPFEIATLSTHLESKTTLPLMSLLNLITSTSYALNKLAYSNSNKTMTFYLGILSSGFHTLLK